MLYKRLPEIETEIGNMLNESPEFWVQRATEGENTSGQLMSDECLEALTNFPIYCYRVLRGRSMRGGPRKLPEDEIAPVWRRT